MLRFHTQTGGATLTAQQPENNIVRTALEALAAVLGGTQSLHTNSFDEALALPTEQAAKIALRTQQVIGYETGVAETVDPLGGSYFVESLTDELERAATEYLEKIDAMGGAVAAIEAGFYQDEIHEAAFRDPAGDRDRRAGRRRREPVRRRRRAGPSSCRRSPRRRPRSSSTRLRALRADRGPAGGRCCPRGGGGDRARHGEPAPADAGGAAAPRDPRRGVGRAPPRLRRVPADLLVPGRLLGFAPWTSR